jgi:hypothetical protein
MAGTAKVYFANRLSLTVNDGTSDHTIAVIHGAEITWNAEHVEEYGMDSTLREDVVKIKQSIDVKIKYAKFDPIVTEWWQMGILAGDPDGGTGAMVDTNDVALYSVVGTLTDGAGTPQILKATIAGVYFPSMPLILTENQYVQHDLSGKGKSITYANA